MQKEEIKSYGMVIASMLIFGTIGIFRRYIPLSSGFLACARGIIGGTCLCFWMKIRGLKIQHKIGWKNTVLLAVIGAMIGVNWILLFEAYNYTTVATATLCYYMQPTIVLLLSPLIFKEKLTKKKMICALLALVGMFFVSGMMEGNGIHSSDAKGILFGLMAAVLYACVIIMNKLVKVKDAYERTIIQLFFAAIVMIPYLILSLRKGQSFFRYEENQISVSSLIKGVPAFTAIHNFLTFFGIAILMLLIVGVVHTGLAYALYFGGMSGLKSQSIAVLSYIDPVFALILSVCVLHEGMSIYGMIGAGLVLGSAIFSEFS